MVVKVNIFSGEILKKKCLKLVKKATCFFMSGVFSLGILSGCGGQLDHIDHNSNTNNSNVGSSQNTGTVENVGNSAESKEDNFSYDESNKDYSRDVSEDYVTVFVGDTDGVIVANRNNIVRYKDSSNAYTRNASGFEDSQVEMEDDDFAELNEFLENQKVDIPYSELFNVEHLMDREKDVKVEHRGTFNLVNGRVDENELYRVVKINNENYNYSITFTDDELKNICHIVAQNLNYSLATNPYVDREALKCFLSEFKIFKANDVSNACITKDGVLAISPDSIEMLQKNAGSLVDAFGATIAHESGGHIPQMNCNDEVDKTKGDKLGFNVKYDDEPINSLFWNWYFEASAESTMTNATGTPTLVYQTKVNYLKYLKLTMAMKAGFDADSLENVSASRDRDDLFSLFGIVDEKDKVDFANVMYAIELIQNESKEFEKLYLAYMNEGKSFMSNEDWIQLRYELKSALAINLSSMFYKNLAVAVREGRVTLKDVYHIISVFEAEIESHNTYDSLNIFEKNTEFMRSYIEMQDAFFSCISTSYTFAEVVAGFDVYSFQDGASLNGLSDDAKSFVETRREELHEKTTSNIRTFYDTLSSQYDRALELN